MNDKQHADRFIQFVDANPTTRDRDLLFQGAVVEQLCNINSMLRRFCAVMLTRLDEGDDDADA